ncbi:membrane protein insertion efficiency factor YidD [bacterium]|nr:membrane protein insertion efficiency factor YidD [bacterium]
MVQMVLFSLKSYKKVISPLLPPSCRYDPTCSEYAILAIVKYGLLKGSCKSMLRLMKCNPFFPGGYDPV